MRMAGTGSFDEWRQGGKRSDARGRRKGLSTPQHYTGQRQLVRRTCLGALGYTKRGATVFHPSGPAQAALDSGRRLPEDSLDQNEALLRIVQTRGSLLSLWSDFQARKSGLGGP